MVTSTQGKTYWDGGFCGFHYRCSESGGKPQEGTAQFNVHRSSAEAARVYFESVRLWADEFDAELVFE